MTRERRAAALRGRARPGLGDDAPPACRGAARAGPAARCARGLGRRRARGGAAARARARGDGGRRARAAAGRRAHRARLARPAPGAQRYAPPGALRDPAAAVGQRAAVAIAPRTDLVASLLAVPGADSEPPGPRLRRGERALDLVAVGAADAVVAGARVDVLVTYDGRAGAPGPTRLALADVEVLAARPPPSADGADSAGGLPRLLATL